MLLLLLLLLLLWLHVFGRHKGAPDVTAQQRDSHQRQKQRARMTQTRQTEVHVAWWMEGGQCCLDDVCFRALAIWLLPSFVPAAPTPLSPSSCVVVVSQHASAASDCVPVRRVGVTVCGRRLTV